MTWCILATKIVDLLKERAIPQLRMHQSSGASRQAMTMARCCCTRSARHINPRGPFPATEPHLLNLTSPPLAFYIPAVLPFRKPRQSHLPPTDSSPACHARDLTDACERRAVLGHHRPNQQPTSGGYPQRTDVKPQLHPEPPRTLQD